MKIFYKQEVVSSIKENFRKGDRVKRKGYEHEGYIVIGYNGAGSVIVLPLEKADHWSNYDVFIKQQLMKINH